MEGKTDDHHEYCTGGFDPDDVVISGISGRFPFCNTLEELKEALYTSKNLLLENCERYEKGADDIPFGSTGTIRDIEKFDYEYFRYNTKYVQVIDPTHKKILEVSYEALADAGYEPTAELQDADIGIYTAISNEDAKHLDVHFHGMLTTGHLRAMAANRCSHHFKFTGPSYTMDSACSSSAVAMWSAYHDVKDGRVGAALVNAGQFILSPLMAKSYVLGGLISMTNACNPFDERANGIVRTEAITAFFIQKASSARRAYATIKHMKHVAAGYVPEGLSVPSVKGEVRLFQDVLKEAKLNPEEIDYIEAHGTGTAVGDPVETKAIETVYCTEKRKEPLLIGTVKSNLGHSEAAAGQSGAIKAIFAFETGVIAPNYGFQTPNPECEALINGKIKVVTEPVPLTSQYIPFNSFGFGGSFVQGILKKNPIEYSSVPVPEEMPRLVLFPGNTEAAVHHMFDYIKSHPDLQPEFFALLNKLSFATTDSKPFRGYALFQNEEPLVRVKKTEIEEKREVWFIMTGMGCQWSGMGLEMMKIKLFANSMKKSASVLKPLGIDLFELLRKDTKYLETDRSITPAFVTIAAIQIALVDVLRHLEINPDYIIGHSTGELICAYADGCCTAEQTILSAYWRGKCVESANLKVGSMAAVGLSWEEAILRCPKDVHPACHNADDSVTISGLKEPLEKFVAELKKEDIFARIVNAYGYAFHCEHVWPAAEKLKSVLLKIIKDPKPRTERWISTSYPEEESNTESCRLAGPEYFVHNLMSRVLFSDALKKIPADAITIEIGPHFLLQSILKRSIGSRASYIGLMKRNDDNNIGFFMESLGKLYQEGLSPVIEKLYRPVKFPVPRGTPVISDLIQWNHSASFPIAKPVSRSAAFVHTFQIDANDSYLLDHFIDGRSLFPATGYVWLAWQALAKSLQKQSSDDVNVVIEDFKIHRATVISPAQIRFHVSLLQSTGKFEITESNSLVASGVIYNEDNMVFCEPDPIINKDGKDSSLYLSGTEIYDELRISGYEYGQAFRKLIETSFDGREGFVEWKDDWITFMDALLIFYLFANVNRTHDFLLPTGALSFKICPKVIKSYVEECLKEGLPGLPVNFYVDSKICRTVGLEIRSLDVDTAPQHTRSDACVLEEYKFVPYLHKYTASTKNQNLNMYMIACNKIIGIIEKKLNRDLGMVKFPITHNIDFDVDHYINEASGQMKLLTALKTIVSKAEDNLEECKPLFKEFIQDIGKDVVNTSLVNDYCLRYMLEVMVENLQKKTSILEINDGFPLILPALVELVEISSMMKFKNKILVCKDTENVDSNKINDCDITLHSRESLSTVASEGSQSVVIGAVCVSTAEEARNHIQLLSSLVDQNGFILLFHKNSSLLPEILLASLAGQELSIIPQSTLETWFKENDLVIVSAISDEVCGKLYLLRHRAVVETGRIIRISDNASTWLDELKASVSKEEEKTWVVSEECSSSGIIGMINCLRHEPGGDKIRCVFIPQKNKEKNIPLHFSFEDSFFQDILKKDLVMNVYKDGCWGSYRSIKINAELQPKMVDYSYVNIKRYGDLSSLVWMESAMNYISVPDENLVHIYYSALNFRDVMLATGKISAQSEIGASRTDKCVLGLEFSGKNKHGQRISGLCFAGGLSTAAETIPSVAFHVPDEWSLEDAATIPVVYSTCYYSLILRAGLQRGESILIHSGTGGVGIAAINIALSMDCEIFTTVGTERKRKYILEHFPTIKSENIGCSRNTTFENMIMKQTKGRGVDVVLNSLADDKFQASVRCVAMHGRFVEIGKYDLAMDHKLGLKFFLKNITFHSAVLDLFLKDKDSTHQRIRKLVNEGIKNGVVKPLDRTVFQRDEAEKAFRYMGSGTHIGKVLLKIRDEEHKFQIPKLLRQPALPVTYFYPHKVYIIVGGLGGFGIEVSKWLLQKGARNLVLTTRYGARTPYHHFCLKRWKNEGYNVIVSTRNVSIKDDATKLLKEVSAIGPVGGIFNSAIVLHDAFLENVSLESFKEVCAPKADATRNLDALSRSLCPELDHFVCFSSISCGRGNAGQMNYGYANSVMERICEERVANGYPGLSIQWGIIGEVGVVHRHMGDDAMIAGVVAQRVRSCLNILNVACQMKRPVVCSYVTKGSSSRGSDRGDYLQQLARIFGLNDPSEFNATRSFGEMGIDSIVGIEVKHFLETSCDLSLSMKDIQELKLEDVKALLEKVESEKKKNLSTALVSTSSVKLPKFHVHPHVVTRLNDVQAGVPVFLFDIDCDDLSQLSKLGKAIDRPVYALLWSDEHSVTNLESLARWYIEKILQVAPTEAHIVALSSASVLSLEIALQNQKLGTLSLTLAVIDGYFHLLKTANKENKQSEVDIICNFVENYIPSAMIRLKEELSETKSFEQQVRTVVDLFTRCSTTAVNKPELTKIISSNVKRLKLLDEYSPEVNLSKDLLIIEDSSKLLANDVAEAKMQLSELCSGKITVQRIPEMVSMNEESIQKIASVLKSIV